MLYSWADDKFHSKGRENVKMMKFRKMFAIILAAVISAIPAANVLAESSSSSEKQITDREMPWETYYYYNNGTPTGNYYLMGLSIGTAVNASDSSDAYYAYMIPYFDANGFSFSLAAELSDSGFMTNSSEQDFTNPFYFETDSGLSAEVTATLPANSDEWKFESSQTVGGMSIDALFAQELKTHGRIEVKIPISGWGGQSGKAYWLTFELPGYNDEFQTLYTQAEDCGWYDASTAEQEESEATSAPTTEQIPSPAPTTELTPIPETAQRYTNDEIQSVCQTYMNSVNNAMEIAANINQNYESGSYGWMLIGIIGSLQPIEDFLNAYEAFNNLVYADMTSEQQEYYNSVKSAVGETKLGQIIQAVQTLEALGIL